MNDSHSRRDFPATAAFVVFCFLLAARDVFADKFLAADVHVSVLLFFYTGGVMVCAAFAKLLPFDAPSGSRPLLGALKEHRGAVALLGIATAGVYAVTLLGIKNLTAPVFNAIDYGAMPVMTLAAAGLALRERPTRAQVIGGVVGGIGVVVLCLVPDPRELGTSSSWAFWLAVSFASPILTAACSALQTRLLVAGYSPADVLILRFPISALVFGAWMVAGNHRVDTGALPGLIGVTIVGAFVPLWLLCFGLLRRGLSSLAGFLLLIPVFTFALGPLVLKERWTLLMSPWIVGGAALLILGYLLAEGYIGKRSNPAA